MKKYILLISILMVSLYMYGCKGEFLGPGMADFDYKLSGDYKLFHAGETDIWTDNGMSKAIERNVTGIAWDNDFILVEQEKNKSISYWVIDVKGKKIYGAFNKSEFEDEKQELKINAQLKLEKPEKYKHLDEANENMK
ncbi:DUF3997 domain-containing protein [Clostridium sp. YIM B02515]|uniref:DUF3997 domain-containing protein n=1 Tax=Clostridium rhizosphaerae TaxID=2803861 RepID=A0ABS1T8R8_9CLOT|nr:DUF3997 domain-containing protein [Clostridium rhizosphaerae]MBL4935076.1 DUF3997 domain-containing protein [Clostridium rhizosphaerae]